MNRTTAAYLLGPEIAWLLMLAIAGLIVMFNQPVVSGGHFKLIWMNWYLPTIGVILAFIPLFWAPGNQWWWLVRIVISGLIGVSLLVGFLSKSASYDDIRDVGVIMGFVFFVGIGWAILLGVGSVMLFFLMAHLAFLPVLKWILIFLSLVLITLRVSWELM
ncbi:hypothetical protein GO755_15245 [Spirosoma sp. HMF4905]|uniref:Uncharacterized protein n=1 Tax=Spirosoma arboris TaxID=2682092 RepID=A0A7K1SC73_9BACT|nr:hypothetical protein [Spirosoma arboris]MVM31399.1 hypothetical protein [Spirosoma arboris]